MNVTEQLAGQMLDDVIGEQAAAVEALVNHRAFSVGLREEVAVEARVAAVARVGQVNVSELTIAHLIDLAAVAFDPRQIAQGVFVRHGYDCDLTRACAIRIGADFDEHLLVSFALKRLIDVVLGGQFAPAHRQ